MSLLSHPNTLYYGDNLPIMRENIPDESVDLIYLDPPFNSDAEYNVLFKDPTGKRSVAQTEAFKDTWHWSLESEKAYDEAVRNPYGMTQLSEMLIAIRGLLKENDMMAYLSMMAVRMIEMWRVLKPTGSIYLHCDPTASHYLKILLDSIFGKENFRNEIIWCYRKWSISASQYSRNHDVILFYSKNKKENYFNVQFTEPSQGTIRRWGGQKQKAYFEDGIRKASSDKSEKAQTPLADWWDISILNPNSKERLGYPTQKPLELLERIILSSSKPGDVILDPFCGCGTTIHAAERLERKWIGIDLTHLAIDLIKKRLTIAFQGDVELQIVGAPKDLEGAQRLAELDRFEFERWATSLLPFAVPWKSGRKGPDTGIDAVIYLQTGKVQGDRVIVEVKSGAVGVDQIHKLKSVVERERAAIGLFVTLKAPTRPMLKEAASSGFVEISMTNIPMPYPKIQILTIEGLLNGQERPLIPAPNHNVFRRPEKEYKHKQKKLDL